MNGLKLFRICLMVLLVIGGKSSTGAPVEFFSVIQNSSATVADGDAPTLIAISQNPSHNAGGGFSLWKQPTCDDKLEKLGTYIPQLLKKVESNQDNLECANESLRSDLQRWQLEKQQCLKKILLDFVNKQINYYQASVNSWEYVTNELNQQNTSLRNNSK